MPLLARELKSRCLLLENGSCEGRNRGRERRQANESEGKARETKTEEETMQHRKQALLLYNE